jgi:hypothetical protein
MNINLDKNLLWQHHILLKCAHLIIKLNKNTKLVTTGPPVNDTYGSTNIGKKKEKTLKNQHKIETYLLKLTGNFLIRSIIMVSTFL